MDAHWTPRILPPTLTEVADVEIKGAHTWIFAVDDDEAEIAVSSEFRDGDKSKIRVGRMNPTGLSSGMVDVDWNDLVTFDDVEIHSFYSADKGETRKFSDLSDHWHIYTGGYHWIACSLKGDTADEPVGVLLIKFTLDLSGVPTRASGFPKLVLSTYVLTDYYKRTDPAGAIKYMAKHPTNDLFMVRRTGRGVAIGVYHESATESVPTPDSDGITAADPNYDEGHRILLVDEDGVVEDENGFYGLTKYISGFRYKFASLGHTNGGSARLVTEFSDANVRSCYRVLVPTSIEVNYETRIRLITVDSQTWSVEDIQDVRDGEGSAVHYSMAMEAAVGSLGYTAMVYKAVNVSAVVPPAAVPTDDGGQVNMRIYSPTGTSVERIEIAETTDFANRPHICRFGNLLVVTWDTSGHAYMKVFETTW